ncbi:MFS transporter [Georgenia ruanii]|uniref:MFS transporter n=1 Tax=Georgenia ruanii TaxID=348442 RepID=A0A7J9UT67_9MICO|nr:MFS transporter [Georgenia ruanii]MPV87070.1 MFS transporter [Georgenia ruanii]
MSAAGAALTAPSARRRFLILTALRWLPVGLVIPVAVLLPLDRGLSLAQVGLAAALQGLVVLALELPTGGLADTLGRRTVLLLASAVGVGAMALYLAADSLAMFAAVFALQGVFRALDSGPLEAWYVDAALGADPRAAIDRGLSAHSAVLGVAIAAGALAGGGLVAWAPLAGLEALATPVAAALVLQVAGLGAIAALMVEPRRASGPRAAWRAAVGTPRAIADGIGLLRRNRVLLALVAVELSWGFGMVAFEQLTPVRLLEILGDPDAAAAVVGPASSAAWLASAAGATLVPLLAGRLGFARFAALTRLLQAVTVVGIGLFGGVVGVVTAYLACYVVHGAANPAHMTLLHRQVDGARRATVVSLNSMAAQPAGALGAVALTALADAASVGVAVCLGAVVLVLAAPLYLPAWRQERAERRARVASPGRDGGQADTAARPVGRPGPGTAGSEVQGA